MPQFDYIEATETDSLDVDVDVDDDDDELDLDHNIDIDDDDVDDAASTSSYASTSSATSVDSAYGTDTNSPSPSPSQSRGTAAAVHKHAYDGGRRFHYFRTGKYPLPNDACEQDREDMKHALVLALTGGDGQLRLAAPVTRAPQRIIDVGTGTGLWAMEMGTRFPQAHVVGVDLSPIQPAVGVPPNVTFVMDDVEDEWSTSTSAELYDYAHVRGVLQFVDAVKVLGRTFDNLRPGGWIETGDLDGEVHCDDGTMPADWPVKRFWELLAAALPLSTGEYAEGALSARDMRVAPRTGALLAAAGFVHVSCQVYKVPHGPWPADATMRAVGMYMRQIMRGFVEAGTLKTLRPLGLPDDVVASFLATVHEAAKNCGPRGVHSYTRYYVWTAQKPEK